MLRFEEEEQSNARKHPRPLSETADAQPVRFATTTPPAARFLSREINRGKSAAGLRPCTPVRRALKRRGHRFDDKQAGAGRESAISDDPAGNARLLFRVLFAVPEQGSSHGESRGSGPPCVRLFFFQPISIPRPSSPEGGSNGGNRRAVSPLAGRRGPGEPFGRFPGRFFFFRFLFVAQKEI